MLCWRGLNKLTKASAGFPIIEAQVCICCRLMVGSCFMQRIVGWVPPSWCYRRSRVSLPAMNCPKWCFRRMLRDSRFGFRRHSRMRPGTVSPCSGEASKATITGCAPSLASGPIPCCRIRLSSSSIQLRRNRPPSLPQRKRPSNAKPTPSQRSVFSFYRFAGFGCIAPKLHAFNVLASFGVHTNDITFFNEHWCCHNCTTFNDYLFVGTARSVALNVWWGFYHF